MFGAIIGDIASENIENNKEKRNYIDCTKVYNELINDYNSYTINTVLSLAIMDSLINNKEYKDTLLEYRNNFEKNKYNEYSKSTEDYTLNSNFAIRATSIGYYFNTLDKVIENAKKQTIVTNNSIDVSKESEAVACTINLARHIKNKEKIKKIIESLFNYNLNYDLEKINENTLSNKDIVPLSISIFLNSNNFTDSIKISLFIKNYASTLASITGAISEAYYGVPVELIKKVWNKLPKEYKDLLSDFYKYLNLKQVLYKLGIIDDNFYNYIKDKIEKNYISEPINWKVFPIYKNKKIIDMKINIPYLTNRESFNINIGVLYKAYKIYKNMEKEQVKIKNLHK